MAYACNPSTVVQGQLRLNTKCKAILSYMRGCLETRQQMKTRSLGSRKRKGSEPRCSGPCPHGPSPQRAVEWLGSTLCTGLAQVCSLERSLCSWGPHPPVQQEQFPGDSRMAAASPPTPWLPVAQQQPRQQPGSAAGVLCSPGLRTTQGHFYFLVIGPLCFLFISVTGFKPGTNDHAAFPPAALPCTISTISVPVLMTFPIDGGPLFSYPSTKPRFVFPKPFPERHSPYVPCLLHTVEKELSSI